MSNIDESFDRQSYFKGVASWPASIDDALQELSDDHEYVLIAWQPVDVDVSITATDVDPYSLLQNLNRAYKIVNRLIDEMNEDDDVKTKAPVWTTEPEDPTEGGANPTTLTSPPAID